jgi:hypothetical protein
LAELLGLELELTKLQFLAYTLWGWIIIMGGVNFFSCLGVLFDQTGEDDYRKATASAVSAILGLMLIQTLGLTV